MNLKGSFKATGNAILITGISEIHADGNNYLITGNCDLRNMTAEQLSVKIDGVTLFKANKIELDGSAMWNFNLFNPGIADVNN